MKVLHIRPKPSHAPAFMQNPCVEGRVYRVGAAGHREAPDQPAGTVQAIPSDLYRVLGLIQRQKVVW